MVSRVSVASEVDHPDIVAPVREEEAEAGVPLPHDDVRGCGLVTMQIEDHRRSGDTWGDPESAQ